MVRTAMMVMVQGAEDSHDDGGGVRRRHTYVMFQADARSVFMALVTHRWPCAIPPNTRSSLHNTQADQ